MDFIDWQCKGSGFENGSQYPGFFLARNKEYNFFCTVDCPICKGKAVYIRIATLNFYHRPVILIRSIMTGKQRGCMSVISNPQKNEIKDRRFGFFNPEKMGKRFTVSERSVMGGHLSRHRITLILSKRCII